MPFEIFFCAWPCVAAYQGIKGALWKMITTKLWGSEQNGFNHLQWIQCLLTWENFINIHNTDFEILAWQIIILFHIGAPEQEFALSHGIKGALWKLINTKLWGSEQNGFNHPQWIQCLLTWQNFINIGNTDFEILAWQIIILFHIGVPETEFAGPPLTT